jgi:membrane protein implicated in regulation of membrane protease activity
MTTIFMICVVFGGTILAFQFVMAFIGFGHSDFDGGDHIPDSLDVGMETDGMDGNHLDVGDPHGSTALFAVLSFKTVVAALTFFGIGGMAAESGGVSIPGQLTVAVVAGLGALYGVYYLMRSVSRLAQSGNLRISNAIGRTATVYIPIPAGNEGQGKVQVKIQDRMEEFTAVTSAGEKLSTGAKVVVVKVVSGTTLEVEPLVETQDASV